ncbi:MAG: radical SAM protein [Candidatus Omnitrophota bacterium]
MLSERLNVILINPLDPVLAIGYPTSRPPYDLLYLDSYLYHKQIGTDLLDVENEAISEIDFGKYIEKKEARYYVINTTGRTHHFHNFKKARRHIKRIISIIRKINPRAFIIFTGESAIVYVKRYFYFDVDCILFDEPEYTLFEIVSNKITNPEQLRGIKGIYYRDNGVFIKNVPRDSMKSLDELPPPRWEKLGGYFWDSPYRQRREFIDIPGMRGCPYNCGFCKSSLSKKVLSHSPSYLLEQIRVLHADFGYADFFIRDAGYFDDDLRCQQLCEGLKEIKGIIWKCNARIDNMSLEKLKLMKDSGCSLISYGGESGNDETLKIENKRISTEDIKQTIAITKESGIKVAVYFILDFPSESFRDKLRTLIFARGLNADVLYINQYYLLKDAGRIKTIITSFELLLNILLASLLLMNNSNVVYLRKIRINNIGANLGHYFIHKSKIKW